MIRPLFAPKIKVKNKITLDEDSQSIKDDQKVANSFNSFFVNTHLVLRYSAINHYLKIEIFQTLWNMQLKILKIIAV